MRVSGVCAAALLGGLLLAGCGAREGPRIHAVEGPPEAFPAPAYRQALRAGKRVYRVDPCLSRVTIRVSAGGPLAELGHNHVVSTRELHGYVLDPAAGGSGRTDIYVPVTALEVDKPRLVEEAGFDTELSEQEKAQTRYNMLAEVLEAHKYPYVRIHATPAPDSPTPPEALTVDLTIHGETQTRRVPVRMRRTEDWLEVRGRLSVRHEDFGMEPFTALAGQLRVKEELDLRFLVHATVVERWNGAGAGSVLEGGARRCTVGGVVETVPAWPEGTAGAAPGSIEGGQPQ
ncbi:YceI family protein [Thiohalorhabdus methylotrophus]|uniref:YceI family protein n=1 Tax=Thiohalorhabdus methylotrophus TaxID=3242694 RepID=A0ABV4TTK1_9GAMM